MYERKYLARGCKHYQQSRQSFMLSLCACACACALVSVSVPVLSDQLQMAGAIHVCTHNCYFLKI